MWRPALCEYRLQKSFHTVWPPRWVVVWSSRAILRASSSFSSNHTCKIVSSGGGGSTGRRLSPSTCVWDFPGRCFTVKSYSSSGGEERIPFALSSATAKCSGRCRPQMVLTSNKVGTLRRPRRWRDTPTWWLDTLSLPG